MTNPSITLCTKAKNHCSVSIGIKRFSKSIWKSFKTEFKDIEENLIMAREEVVEELRLASEQAAHGFRRLLLTEIEENRVLRLQQVVDMQESKQFRSKQMDSLQKTENRQIQKDIKEKGKLIMLDDRHPLREGS